VTFGLVVAAALAGVAVGAWLELVVARVPEKIPLRVGPTFGPEGIGWRRRPLVLAIATSALFGGVAARLGDDWALPAFLVFTAGAVALTTIDLETYLLPNRIVFPLAGAGVALLGLAALAQWGWVDYTRALVGGACGFVAFFALHIVSPRALGFGDVKFAFVLGLYLGWLGWGEIILGFFLGFAYGAVIGIVLLATRLRGRKDPVPFGPFLAAGTMTAILWGAPIVDWYRGT